jgi:hypothetical protein
MLKLLLLPAVIVPEKFKKYRMVILYGFLLFVIVEFFILVGLIGYLHHHPEVALEQTLKKWVRMLK